FKLSNIRVPEEIAVIGYDDIELGNYFSPLLTTVHQPREEISSLAIERLVQLIESNPRRNHKEIVVKPSLVIRESCGTKLSLPK
ncbi:MAG: substrate-binding domain-containing protein, partial [Sphaerochaetaceae bacterium]